MWLLVADKYESTASRAYSVLFLLVHSSSGWLICTRKTHPLLGKMGFLHCVPASDQPITVTASEYLKSKTGLQGDFSVIGSGFLRIYEDEKLESFTNFTALLCDSFAGTLTQQDNHAAYSWHSMDELSTNSVIKSVPRILEEYKISNGKLFYIDDTFTSQ